jgi:hypothetical protein
MIGRKASTGSPAGSLQLPIEITLAGIERPSVAAAHGDHYFRVLGVLSGECLRELWEGSSPSPLRAATTLGAEAVSWVSVRRSGLSTRQI